MAKVKRRRVVAGFPAASPEAMGLSPEPLRRLRAAIRHNVGRLGALPGCAHIVLKGGRCVFAMADGHSDIRKRVPFSFKTLCPLHGATKPLVAAAFFTLVDEGKVRLSDPISKYIRFPEVVRLKSGATRRVRAPPTLRHLLAMAAGVGYDDAPGYKSAMRRVARGEIADLRGMCEALGAAPLAYEPGTRYHYSFSADLVGRVCEVVSGQRIDKFVASRLLKPLGMRDTHFDQVVPASKRRRQAVMYTSKRTRGTKFELKPTTFARSAPGIMSCGGGVLSYRDYGMLSTAQDYARFCQMLASGGLIPGSRRRLLKASTVRMLWHDGLTPFQRKDGKLPGWNDCPSPSYWNYMGWSLLNTHLCLEEAPRKSSPRKGSSMWMGGGGGAFWSIDARRDLVTLSFAPVFLGRATEDDGLGPLANDAG
eukprot:CAMPEP_0170228532 /NCGR_PEP_ID=MMETSP0116_2-20130129/13986_1 /TAXON_ID=400756 /ORGANISM="Durinskia baltica, Strain CSIRO CS-38" /LENGTH=421 /DNA_ID=CAMNT_0010479275 /DNA_START=87 /DNA_END=1348 /DNA_ORIENTATION=+